jgi:two-component system response regulator DesR
MERHLREIPLRVLIAEDVTMLRSALVTLLELHSDIRVVAQVDRGDRILAAAVEHRPDVAVLDLDLPALSGLAAAVQLREHLPDCRILIITGIDKPGMLRRVLQSGVSGVMLKSAP